MSRGMVYQPYNAKVPYDFMVRLSDKIGKTWVDVMTAEDLYNKVTFFTFEDDFYLR